MQQLDSAPLEEQHDAQRMQTPESQMSDYYAPSSMLEQAYATSSSSRRPSVATTHSDSATASSSSAQPPPRQTGIKETQRVRNAKLDALLLQLKTASPDIPWSEVAARAQAQFGDTFQVPALQMRWKRLTQARSNAGRDDRILAQAIRDYEANKWQIVAMRMKELGAAMDWSARDCQRRWLTLELDRLRAAGGEAGDAADERMEA